MRTRMLTTKGSVWIIRSDSRVRCADVGRRRALSSRIVGLIVSTRLPYFEQALTMTLVDVDLEVEKGQIPPPAISTVAAPADSMVLNKHTDPFATREGKTLTWKNVNMTLVRPLSNMSLRVYSLPSLVTENVYCLRRRPKAKNPSANFLLMCGEKSLIIVQQQSWDLQELGMSTLHFWRRFVIHLEYFYSRQPITGILFERLQKNFSPQHPRWTCQFSRRRHHQSRRALEQLRRRSHQYSGAQADCLCRTRRFASGYVDAP
jgi:hypothetical protein